MYSAMGLAISETSFSSLGWPTCSVRIWSSGAPVGVRRNVDCAPSENLKMSPDTGPAARLTIRQSVGSMFPLAVTPNVSAVLSPHASSTAPNGLKDLTFPPSPPCAAYTTDTCAPLNSRDRDPRHPL